MSHTFEKVNENILVADSKELAEMIREGELFFIWKRKYVEKKFLHVCKNIGIAAEENDSVTVLKKMRKRITGLNQSIHSIDTEVAELKRGQAQIVNTLGSFERVLESLVEGQNEIREIVKKIESK
jgi:hypothetical protein